MDYAISLDQTAPVTEGMKEILWTLLIAIVLVILVVYLFLQDWRATLIPLLAVPVSLVGTFILFPLFGFSINTLSMFGLVLAIGLVVDDAIVVVEGVQRHIEEGLNTKDAARKAMEELSGPVIGIALVLSSVFVLTAFIPGITGRLYQQFAVTIAISVVLPAFNALTLSPALAGLLLRKQKESHGPLQRFFNWFNRLFERATGGYVHWSGVLLRKGAMVLVLLVACGAAGLFFGSRLPSSFLPDEDQGYLYINMQLPDAASIGRSLHRLRSQCQCFLIAPQPAQSFDLRIDCDGRIRNIRLVLRHLNCLVERSKSFAVLLQFDQTSAVDTRVSNVSSRISNLGHGPCLDYVLLRSGNVSQKECRDPLLANSSGGEQVVMPLPCEGFDLRPRRTCHRGVVIHFQHPKDRQDAKPCLRVLRLR